MDRITTVHARMTDQPLMLNWIPVSTNSDASFICLDKRAESINRWLAVMAIVLTFFGIVAVVAGYISFERFRELEKETRNRVEQLVDKIKDLADKAEADAGKSGG